ncbi:MAG: PD-(D/E)XK nuclease family protein [Deltaproteobacteria bacterium]|jgi:ATP-dependent helicase/DNAse subunit B|nr:PD-(D/E)XK nuclease family protein [Deltaproteobacteria bacterium]
MTLAAIPALRDLLAKPIFSGSELIVVPNDLVIFQLREEILSQKSVLLNVQIYTFGALEKKLTEEYWPAVIGEFGRSFLLNYLAPDLWAALDLPPEPSLSQLNELAGQLGDGLDRLRLAGLTWEEVGGLQPASLAQALARTGALYEKHLGQLDDTFSCRLKLLASLKENRNFKFLTDIKTVHCYHSQRLSPFESELLKALALSGRKVNVRLDIPPWLLEEKTGLNTGFQRLRLIRDFEKSDIAALNLEFAEPDFPNYPQVPEALRFAASNLFGPPARESPPPVNGAIKIYKAPARYQEVEAVGRLIKKDIAGGRIPHHLAAAVPQLEDYLADFEDISRRFGLKFFYRRGVPLDSCGPVLAVSDLLALFLSSWETARVWQILSSPYYDFSSFGPICDITFEELLSAGVTDDRAGGGFEENIRKAIGRGEVRFQPVLEAVAYLRQVRERFQHFKTWPQFLSVFQTALNRLKWPCLPPDDDGTVEKIWPEFERPGDIQAQVIKEYGQKVASDRLAADRLNEAVSRLAAAIASSPFVPDADLITFSSYFSDAVGGAYLGRQDTPADRVWLVNYYDLHGAQFDKLYLLGLNDKVFPAARAEGCWWPPEFLKSLSQTSLGRSLWSGAAERYQQGEEIISAALGQADEVVLSYTEFDNGSPPRQLLPSPVIESLKALWPENSLKTLKMSDKLKASELADPSELLVCLAEKTDTLPPELAPYIPDLNPQALWNQIKSRSRPGASAVLDARAVRKWLKGLRDYDGIPIIPIPALRDYAFCSRLFWYGYVLGLSGPAGAVEDWSFFDQGSFIHGVLEQFLNPLVSKSSRGDYSWNKLKEIFELFASNLAETSAVGRLPLFEETLLSLKNLLKGWLARQDGFQRAQVYALEWAFGLKDKEKGWSGRVPPLILGAGEERFGLAGRIDRLDLTGDGLNILDYKLTYSDSYCTGTVDSPADVPEKLSGKHYAVMVYRLAAARHFKKPVSAQFEFINPKKGETKIPVTCPPGFFQEFLEQTFAGLVMGRETEPDGCGNCRYGFVCPAGTIASLNKGSRETSE